MDIRSALILRVYEQLGLDSWTSRLHSHPFCIFIVLDNIFYIIRMENRVNNDKEKRNETSVNHQLICRICNKPFNDPQSLSCSHIFCHQCKGGWGWACAYFVWSLSRISNSRYQPLLVLSFVMSKWQSLSRISSGSSLLGETLHGSPLSDKTFHGSVLLGRTFYGSVLSCKTFKGSVGVAEPLNSSAALHFFSEQETFQHFWSKSLWVRNLFKRYGISNGCNIKHVYFANFQTRLAFSKNSETDFKRWSYGCLRVGKKKRKIFSR
jgi:hypothetical protein